MHKAALKDHIFLSATHYTWVDSGICERQSYIWTVSDLCRPLHAHGNLKFVDVE